MTCPVCGSAMLVRSFVVFVFVVVVCVIAFY
jgi:hypothetical protein